MKTLLTTTLLLIALISYSQTGYYIVSGNEMNQDKVETIKEAQEIASKYFDVDLDKLLKKSVYFSMETEGKYFWIEKKRIVLDKNGKIKRNRKGKIKFRKFRK